MRAKCGKVRVWHWAHKTKQHCDHWWEPEKEWHRNWKNQFPEEWQEQGRRDEHGELHIADVLTPNGLVLEFQHSAIKREEVEVRTRFHKNICWIVDGLRLKTTSPSFQEALKHSRRLKSSGAAVFELYFYDCRFLEKWCELGAPVVIDFGTDDMWVIGYSLENSVAMYKVKKDDMINVFKAGHRLPMIEPMPRRRRGIRRRYR